MAVTVIPRYAVFHCAVCGQRLSIPENQAGTIEGEITTVQCAGCRYWNEVDKKGNAALRHGRFQFYEEAAIVH